MNLAGRWVYFPLPATPIANDSRQIRRQPFQGWLPWRMSTWADRQLLLSRVEGWDTAQVTATVLIAALGDGRMFQRGRDAAAWCGLVPGQHSSGGKDKLLGICKRGDAYLRTLLIHGARSVIKAAKDKDDRLSRWTQSLCRRRNKNIAAVALANKTMRMAWALLTSEQDYDPDFRIKAEPA